MAFDTAEPTCYRTNFPYASSGFFVHSTTRNAHYVHPRLVLDFPGWHQAIDESFGSGSSLSLRHD